MTSTSGLVQVGTPAEIPVEKNTTYTISAYVKTTGMASSGDGICLVVDSPGRSRFSEKIKGNTNWRRIEMTFTTQSDVTCLKIFARLQSKGTAYVDCIQLEKQPTASRYNLIENGDFTQAGSTDAAPYGWNPGDGSWVEMQEGTNPINVLSYMYTIQGDPTKNKRLLQNVSAQGKKGDVYTLGGWVMGDSVPATEDDRMFGIIGQFNYTDGTSKQVKVTFDSDLKNDLIWQYVCDRMVAEKDYNSITVVLAFDHNANQVWFDKIQLVKDEFGESYTYDSDGNVISVQDLRSKNTTYEYSNNNLTRAVLPGGASVTYSYDDYHNVKTASTKAGVTSQFGYDEYGNNTSVKVVNPSAPSGSVMEANASYTADGSYLTQIIDVNRKNTVYDYNENTGVLNSVRGPLDTFPTKTNYSYDSMDRLTEVSKNVNGTSNVKYTYDGDHLKNLYHSNTSTIGTTYAFSYGSFDLLTKVMVGNKTLITNSYDTAGKTFHKTKATYGNGNSVAYTYDKSDRLTAVMYDGNSSHKVEYTYDSEDNLGVVTDKRNNLTQRYQYDLSGRLTSVTQSGSAYRKQNFLYDESNNLLGYDENVGGIDFNARYYYDDDNRQNHYNIGSIDKTWEYDNYGRLYNITTLYGNKTVIMTTLFHENPADGYVSPHVISWTNTTASGKKNYDYAYDWAGNITMVRTGGKTTTYAYDRLHQLTRENNQAAGKTWVYTYDTGGNILTKKEYAYTTGTPGTVQKTIYYSYGNSQWKDLLTSYNGKTILSDSIGNMTSDGTWNYTWEHGRQLAGQTKSGTTITYSYDASGMRLKKTVNGTDFNYAYNGNLLTHMSSSSEYAHIRYDAQGLPVHIQYKKGSSAPEEYYYMFNAQGDVVALVDGTGKVVVEYSYDAWGQPLTITGSMKDTLGKANPLRYRCYVYDEETGMYYMGGRYYKPEMCRWISAEPNVDMAGFDSGAGLIQYNVYAYCANNPINNFDPTGEFMISTAVLVGIGIGALVGGIIGGIYGYNKAQKEGADKGDYWKYVVGYAVVGAIVGGVAGGVVGYGTGVALGAKFSGGLTAKSISKALSSVGKNTVHHIMQEKHAWGNVLKDVSWNSVKNLIKKTMKNGATRLIKDQGKTKVYESVYNNIVVRYAVVNGNIRISDAWVRTR